MGTASLTALIVAITSLVTAIGSVIALFRKVGTVGGQVADVSGRVDTVHGLVNNQLDRQLKYNQQMAAALTRAGQPVPEQEDTPGAMKKPGHSGPG